MTGSVPDALKQIAERLHVDAVTTTSPGAFNAISELFGPARILFGSDYPYVPIEATLAGLEALDFGEDTWRAIARGNALNLLGKSD